MADHAHRTIRRHTDVAVVGGSAAGLAAALQLGRQLRSVIVVDSGDPRNAPAAHMHGYLGHEGAPPSELAARGREEVRSYGVEVLSGRVERIERLEAAFLLHTTGGHTIVARRVLAASGLIDELPEIEGVAEQWGRGVVHCPICHGFEIRDQRVVLLVTHPMALHTMGLYRRLTDRLTVVVSDGVVTTEQRDRLAAGGVNVVEGQAGRLIQVNEELTGVELADGRVVEADAIAIGPRFHARIEAFESLGLMAADHVSGLGTHVETDPTGRTSVDGVYAAGNVTDPGQQVLHAAAHGSRVGAMIAIDLADEDLALGSRPSGNAADWDDRYSGEQMWSGNPNGTMVAEVSALTPGRALDVGAGEGGDAVWLAEQGWTVTANDVSARALDRISAEATRRGVAVTSLHADANAHDAFPAGAFDLVSAQYASIPRRRDDRAIHNLLNAVAPGGVLLVVGHDLEPMRHPIDPALTTRIFDPDAYVTADDVARALADRGGWTIERHERCPRPAGAASSHHVDDIVLRARRS